MKTFDLAANLIGYETGQMTENEALRLFAHLIKTKLAWSLQGHYGRTAVELINAGYISRDGTIHWKEIKRRREED